MFMLVAVLAIIVAAAPEAHAIKVKHKATGLVIKKAPKGSKLYHRKGAYRLKTPKATARFMRVRSRLGLKQVAKNHVAHVKGKAFYSRKKSRKRYDIKYKRNGKAWHLMVFKLKKGRFDTILVRTKMPAKKKKRSATRRAVATSDRDLSFVTGRQLQGILSLIRRRQGGRVLLLNTNVPMRRCGNAGASTLSPRMAGWQCSHVGGGVVVGGGPQGFFVFGDVPTFGSLGMNPFQTILPGQFASGPLGTYISGRFNVNATVVRARVIRGSGGYLGPNYNSALYTVRVNVSGRAHDVIAAVGIAQDTGTGSVWAYISMIGVRTAAPPPGLPTALQNSWRAWDPTGANQVRFMQIINTIRTTPPGRNLIDPRVLDEAHDRWVDHIRA